MAAAATEDHRSDARADNVSWIIKAAASPSLAVDDEPTPTLSRPPPHHANPTTSLQVWSLDQTAPSLGRTERSGRRRSARPQNTSSGAEHSK